MRRLDFLTVTLLAWALVSCQEQTPSAPHGATPTPVQTTPSVSATTPQTSPEATSAAEGAWGDPALVAKVPLPKAPADHLFTWKDIQAQIAYGQAAHLRNFSMTEDEWNTAVQGYEQKAIAEIATRKYAYPALLDALRKVPRPFLAYNYEKDEQKTNIPEDYNTIIDIGWGATMSAPSIQAFMTAQLHPTKNMVALEIGTGSGSQSVLLSYLVKKVYTIEVRQPLGERVSRVLKAMGYNNIETKIGDGYYGWKEKAPFDIIIVTCQANHIPPALVEQLKPNGVMVIPVGPAWSQNQQMLKVWKDPKTGKIVAQRILQKTSFIPMLGANEGKN
ncbi:MAG: protein-L-isoaspartate O-methyltransferase [Spirochaetales bacterium]|nr:protein-L-isoaspartate O-methyltransferase [Spirochaetales bacterium]